MMQLFSSCKKWKKKKCFYGSHPQKRKTQAKKIENKKLHDKGQY